MHIAEGILPARVLIGGGALSTAFTAIGLKKLKDKDIPKAALLSGLFFIGSFIHIPLGPTSVHLVLNSVVGIFLGFASFPAILVALFLQAVLFGFGGLTTLGVNTFNMGLPAIASFYFFKVLYRIHRGKGKRKLFLLGLFLIGSGSVALSALLLSFSLYLAGSKFGEVAKLAFIAHVPVMLVEGFIVLFLVLFLEKSYPELLEDLP